MAMKRVFNLSTGDTPEKPKDKKPVCQPNSRRALFSTEEKCSKNTKQEKPIPWSEQETKALVHMYAFSGKTLGMTNGQVQRTKTFGRNVQKQLTIHVLQVEQVQINVP